MNEQIKQGPMACPGCGAALAEVYAEAKYGRVVLLDQCLRCGGVWFDKWELYLFKESEFESLGKFNGDSFAAENPVDAGKNLCPRCSTGLKDFSDPNLPSDACIKRCNSCNGLWLNRGDLKKYALGRVRGPEAKVNGDRSVEALKHLQKELKASSIEAPPMSAALHAERPISTEEIAKDIGFLILQTLVRMVFKI